MNGKISIIVPVYNKEGKRLTIRRIPPDQIS